MSPEQLTCSWRFTTATIYNAPPAMGPAYWIPAFWVPMLLVTHYVTFVLPGRSW